MSAPAALRFDREASSLRLGGLRCAACADTIVDALKAVDGVREASVSVAAGLARVVWDRERTSANALVRAVERAGYTAVPDTVAEARLARRLESRRSLWRLFVAAFVAMQVMMLATPAYVSAPGELAPDLKRLLDAASWVLTLPVLCFSAAPFFAGAWRAVRSRRIGMDVPVALGIAVAFAASSAALFDPAGPLGGEVWFDSLAMFVAFLLGGRHLEMLLRHRAEATLESSVAQLPQKVLRVEWNGAVIAVALETLRVGDTLRVPTGQVVAADGVLLSAATEVDEALITGEGRPAQRARGDTLIAGSLVRGAPADLHVARVGADTRYEQILGLMRDAQMRRTAAAMPADRWAAPFVAGVLLLAVLAALAWHWIAPGREIAVAVAILVVTCPCALALAGPAARVAGAGAMARRGLLLRRLDAIDTLARVDRVFVDKTGTLTVPEADGVVLQRLPGVELAEPGLRGIAAALAAWSSHPVSRALASSDGGATAALQDVTEAAGQGVEGRDAQGATWRLGRASWAGAGAVEGAGAVWLGRDGRALAALHVGERLREDASDAVRQLRHSGIRVAMLSGDTRERVALVASRLDDLPAVAAASPEAKLAVIRQAQRDGACVAMLGDGINDAPVLAQAEVSIAMGEGAGVARAEADAILVSGRLAALPEALRIAARTRRIVRQNTAWAAAYNLTCVPLAALGLLPPWAAGLGMATSSLLVIANAMRASR